MAIKRGINQGVAVAEIWSRLDRAHRQEITNSAGAGSIQGLVSPVALSFELLGEILHLIS